MPRTIIFLSFLILILTGCANNTAIDSAPRVWAELNTSNVEPTRFPTDCPEGFQHVEHSLVRGREVTCRSPEAAFPEGPFEVYDRNMPTMIMVRGQFLGGKEHGLWTYWHFNADPICQEFKEIWVDQWGHPAQKSSHTEINRHGMRVQVWGSDECNLGGVCPLCKEEISECHRAISFQCLEYRAHPLYPPHPKSYQGWYNQGWKVGLWIRWSRRGEADGAECWEYENPKPLWTASASEALTKPCNTQGYPVNLSSIEE